jgi:membrane protein implicated in regulation of membrane protease activity
VHAWLVWLIVSGALAAAESLSLDLVLIMSAGGAAAGAITAGLGGDLAVQVGVAVVVAAGLLVFVRPVARRHLVGVGAQPTGAAALVGREAVVLAQVNAHGGRVRLNGQEWSARSFDKTQVLDVGDTVKVMEIAGATAVVWQTP